ncbi:MAG TPA: YdeI/OmpD-associated family protein [Chitinophaga sp.]|uniref:YdeI/OmpD-associated family protein n=1 Tax=Chitinophaga sp. TaxID=1869181 RepID=UPI002B9388C6|nr:YdeI/OmpD-associated family protein [Chitinophaga sp.]HVI44755.1 YdeI/OmpD-associated family protein [Chitinophaga sp.]
MSNYDPRIDAYIEKSADFAVPILLHMRELVHKACPDITETIKWGMPYFDYNGSILCGMAAFKQHCVFLFWKAALMPDPAEILIREKDQAMGQLGRIEKLKDLPADKIMLQYIREAASLNEAGLVVPRKKPATKQELDIPDYFTSALKKNKKALATFDAFSYSNKKEYVTWVTEAKTEKTREERLATSIEWMAEGKIRNWKYLPKK